MYDVIVCMGSLDHEGEATSVARYLREVHGLRVFQFVGDLSHPQCPVGGFDAAVAVVVQPGKPEEVETLARNFNTVIVTVIVVKSAFPGHKRFRDAANVIITSSAEYAALDIYHSYFK